MVLKNVHFKCWTLESRAVGGQAQYKLSTLAAKSCDWLFGI